MSSNSKCSVVVGEGTAPEAVDDFVALFVEFRALSVHDCFVLFIFPDQEHTG